MRKLAEGWWRGMALPDFTVFIIDDDQGVLDALSGFCEQLATKRRPTPRHRLFSMNTIRRCPVALCSTCQCPA